MSNKFSVSSQVISLPKGGGAVKGIGETFQPNLFSGTGNYSVPIAISPGRNGFGPALSLQYSSGNGNGPFGLGWQLSIPRITRKTEKGLPRYDDTDVFVMSGAEDLVPVLKRIVDSSGHETWEPEDPMTRPPYKVYRYRPRTEGLFARIERWENNSTKEVHWRTITRDNITSIYGRTSASRIADPENERRVYEWLLQETFDALGNHVLYEYARDNPQLYSNEDRGLGPSDIFERNRKATQLYIRRIYYGNLPSSLVDAAGNPIKYPDGTEIGHLREGRRYAFEVVFDYGDWETPTKQPHPEPLAAGAQELFGADRSMSSGQDIQCRFATIGSQLSEPALRFAPCVVAAASSCFTTSPNLEARRSSGLLISTIATIRTRSCLCSLPLRSTDIRGTPQAPTSQQACPRLLSSIRNSGHTGNATSH